MRVNADDDSFSGFGSSVVSAKGLSITCALAMTLLVSSVVCSMQQHPFRLQHQFQHQHGGPRNGIGERDAGPCSRSAATRKSPPPWSAVSGYFLRSWIADLVSWFSASQQCKHKKVFGSSFASWLPNSFGMATAKTLV